MTYTNSKLVNSVVNFNGKNCNPRINKTYNPTGQITKITIHHMAGKMDAKRCAEMHATGGRAASANYYIGNDGKICLGVPENCRAQTSSNAANDYVAVTIEVSNELCAPKQTVSDAAYNSLIKLCIDICQRNGIKQINFTGNKNGNLTMHKYFAATACPGPYLEAKFPDIATKINAGLGKIESKPEAPAPAPTNTISDEEKIQNYLMKKINNPFGAAGLMGNLYAESGLRSNNLQNSYERTLGLTDVQYTNAVNNGTYTNFIYDKAGYGLAQQTYYSRKQNLYSFCKKYGTSIDDLNMQLEFLCDIELPGYKVVQNTLKTANSVKEASDIVLTQFERPADQSNNMKQKRANYGLNYYNKYANKASGNQPSPVPAQNGYNVKVTASALNCRKGPGTQYAVVNVIYKNSTHTIVKEQKGQGQLASNGSQVSLNYVKKI